MIHNLLSWLERRLDIDADELQKDIRKLGIGLVAGALAAVLLHTPETVLGIALSVIAFAIGTSVWLVGLYKKRND